MPLASQLAHCALAKIGSITKNAATDIAPKIVDLHSFDLLVPIESNIFKVPQLFSFNPHNPP
jgi:hypothetical protein